MKLSEIAKEVNRKLELHGDMEVFGESEQFLFMIESIYVDSQVNQQIGVIRLEVKIN